MVCRGMDEVERHGDDQEDYEKEKEAEKQSDHEIAEETVNPESPLLLSSSDWTHGPSDVITLDASSSGSMTSPVQTPPLHSDSLVIFLLCIIHHFPMTHMHSYYFLTTHSMLTHPFPMIVFLDFILATLSFYILISSHARLSAWSVRTWSVRRSYGINSGP